MLKVMWPRLLQLNSSVQSLVSAGPFVQVALIPDHAIFVVTLITLIAGEKPFLCPFVIP
jgi:hypothetical protein